MSQIEVKHLINNLAFTKENFEMLKEELIKSKFPKSISSIDHNFQEDMINDMDMGQPY